MSVLTYEDSLVWNIANDCLDTFEESDWFVDDDWSVVRTRSKKSERVKSDRVRLPDWTNPRSIWMAYAQAPQDPLWGKFACLLNVS